MKHIHMVTIGTFITRLILIYSNVRNTFSTNPLSATSTVVVVWKERVANITSRIISFVSPIVSSNGCHHSVRLHTLWDWDSFRGFFVVIPWTHIEMIDKCKAQTEVREIFLLIRRFPYNFT
jgi:hypothetical protein